METTTINEELESQALAWPGRAQALTVTDQISHDRAADMVIEVVTLRRRIEEFWKPIKGAAKKAHQTAVDAEKRLLDPLQKAEAALKTGIGEWERRQKWLRQEEQRQLEEAQRQADEEARIARAHAAAANGAAQEAIEEILETPVVQAAAVVAPTFAKAKGVATRTVWHAEVTDLRALCRAIADGKVAVVDGAVAIPPLVQANLPVLNQMARALKENFAVPGCRAVAETDVAVRKRVTS